MIRICKITAKPTSLLFSIFALDSNLSRYWLLSCVPRTESGSAYLR